MTALVWDPTSRPFAEGVDRCVLYFDTPIVWNGVTSVDEVANDAVGDPVYLDGIKILDSQVVEEFSLTVEAFTYPSEFDQMITLQQHKEFGFTYRTMRGSYYQIHLVYNVLASPTEDPTATLSNSIAPSVFSWTFTSSPVDVDGIRGAAHFIIDSEFMRADVFAQLEANLYGSSTIDPVMLTIQELLYLQEGMTTIVITDHGDGTWTARGPSSAIIYTDPSDFAITWDTITIIDANTYTITTGE